LTRRATWLGVMAVVALAVPALVCAVTFGGVSASAVSSSFMPCLNALMPLAKSPITLVSLPRPPNSTAITAITISQCQMLKLPMRVPRADGG